MDMSPTMVESKAANVAQSVTQPLLSIRSVAKSFGKNPVLRGISLDIAEGEFLTILGESGSGKTTLLRIIAGFENASSGEILMSGERIDLLPPYRRRVNTVFQNYALFPHLTVAENVAYGLRVANAPKAEITSRVEQALAMVKMTDYACSKPSKDQRRPAAARCTRARLGKPSAIVAARRTALRIGRESAPPDAG